MEGVITEGKGKLIIAIPTEEQPKSGSDKKDGFNDL